jgi:hypothetical protein
LPLFRGFGDSNITIAPAVNQINVSDAIRFRFAFGCDTGTNIFKAGYPRLVVGVTCGTWDESSGTAITLPVGTWMYDTIRFRYVFNFKVNEATSNLAVSGTCVLLQLSFKEDGTRVVAANFWVV